MPLDQNIALWAGYQVDPTKAFKDGQWINGEDYVNQFGVKGPQPGFGTVNDKQGYFADVGGEPAYQKYAETYPGISPLTLANGDGSTQLAPNIAGGMAKPAWGKDESFLGGFMDSVKSTLSEKELMMTLFGATSLGGGLAGAGWGGLGGDIWSGLTNPATTGAGANAGAGGSGAGGGMPNDYQWDMDLGALDGAGGGPLMPPAVPETTAQLKEWGLTETSPGNWAMPAAAASSLLPALTQKLGPQAAQSVLSKLISGEASTADWTNILGKVLGFGAAAIGASQQGDEFRRLADEFKSYGEPSRARYEGSFQPGFSMENEPGYRDALDSTTKSFLHKASINGNPADSPNAWKQTLSDVNSTFAYPALQNYRTMNANTGGYSSFNTAAPGASTTASGSGGNVWNAVGAGVSDIFSPKRTLAEEYAEYRRMIQGA